MSELRPGTARDAVYRCLAGAAAPLKLGDVLEQLSNTTIANASISQALVIGAKCGELDRHGCAKPFGYALSKRGRALLEPAPIAKDLAPPPVTEDSTRENDSFASSLGMRCAVVPENRSQGTIAQALRVVLCADAPLSLGQVLDALPMGWSRAQAISGLKEGVLEGWVKYGADGWELDGEPGDLPETAVSDPLSVAAIPDHMHLRLQEVAEQLREQLRDAVTLGRSPHLVRALASAGAELATAITLTNE